MMFRIKCLLAQKPFSTNIDEFIRVYDGSRYLVLLGSEKCDD